MPDIKFTFSTDRYNIAMLMFRMSDGREVTLQTELLIDQLVSL